MAENKQCPLTQEILTKFRKAGGKIKYSDAYIKDLKIRAQRLVSQVEASRTQYRAVQSQQVADDAARILAMEAENKLLLGDLYNLKGEHLNVLEKWLALWFGEKNKGLIFPVKSAAGEVLTDMQTAFNMGKSTVEQAIQLGTIGQIKRHGDTFRSVLKGAGIPKRRMDELFIESIEVGLIPQHRAGLAIGTEGDKFNMARYNKFKQEMADLGIPGAKFDQIVDSATQVNAILDEIKFLAETTGVTLGNVEGVGFINRILSENAQRWLGKQATLKEAPINLTVQKDVMGWRFNESRKTFHYIPEDSHIVAYQMGIPVEDLNQMIADGTLGEFIYKNVSEAALEKMVDTGSLSKLPMTTREVFDLIRQTYGDLPFHGMSEMFITNPTQLTKYYASNLANAAAKSYLTRSIVQDGMSAGWAASAAVYKQFPDKFPDFVKVDQEVIQKFFPEHTVNEFIPNDVYMHRHVYDQWVTTMDVITNPSLMGALGQTLNQITKFVSQSILLAQNVAYPLRQVYGGFIQFMTGGGNAARIFEGYGDAMRVARAGTDVLDDIQKVYKGINGEMLSERQLFKLYSKKYGSSWVPGYGSGMSAANQWSVAGAVGKPQEFASAIAFLTNYVKTFKDIKGAAKITGEMLAGEQAKAFSAFAAWANFIDNSYKWALLKSLADIRPGNKVGLFATQAAARTADLPDLNKIFDHIDDAFFDWSVRGQVSDKANIVFPFASYMMKNPPAQVRMAMRNPKKFVNYWRIKSFIQDLMLEDQNEEDFKDMNDAVVPSYIQGSSPIFLFKDERSLGFLLANSWNPLEDAWSWFDTIPQNIANLFPGSYIGTAEEKRELISAETKENGRMRLFMQGLVKQFNTVIRNPLSLLTGIDLQTGREIEKDVNREPHTLAGVPVNTWAYTLATMYSPIDRINRSWWAEGITGTPQIVDAKTQKVLVEGKASWAGVPRVVADFDEYTDPTKQFGIRVASTLGFNIKLVDMARQYQLTFKNAMRVRNEVDTLVTRLDKEIRTLRYKGEDKTYPEKYRRMTAQLEQQLESLAALELDLASVALLMKERNIPTEAAIKDFVADRSKLVGNPTFDRQMREIMNRYMTKRQEMLRKDDGKLP